MLSESVLREALRNGVTGLGAGLVGGEKKLLTRSEAFEIGVGVGIMMTTISQTYVG